MKTNRLLLIFLTLLHFGCAPSASSSKAGIRYDHDGYKLGDAVSAEMLKRGSRQPDGTVAVAFESKAMPQYKESLLVVLDNKIAEINFEFDKNQVNDVYGYNEKKYGKPEGANDRLWLWKLDEGGVFVLNREGWGRATLLELLQKREKETGKLY